MYVFLHFEVELIFKLLLLLKNENVRISLSQEIRQHIHHDDDGAFSFILCLATRYIICLA